MTDPSLLILLIEDNPGDALLIKEMLAEEPAAECEVIHAGSVGEASRALAEEAIDTVLLDLSLPDSHGLESLGRVRACARDLPVVVLTGLGDDETAIRAMQEGAQDYLVKGEFSGRSLVRAVRYAIERRRAERIERERRSLESALGAMDHLLGVLGHELRTPLTALRLLSEYLLQDDHAAVEQWERYLKSMNGEVLRMTDLVNNLLEAARLDSGVSQWNWSGVNLAETCRDAVSVVSPLIQSGKVSLVTDIQPADLQIKGDPDAIRRLIVNLANNAVKHTREGQIKISIRAAAPMISIAVSDTGAGISQELAGRLGNAFAINSGVAGSSRTGGTGLGLAICKGIAAAHGGSISVASRPGRGTTFTVTIRADLEAPAAVPPDLKILREAAA
jgi:signal transduction histidine kinase